MGNYSIQKCNKPYTYDTALFFSSEKLTILALRAAFPCLIDWVNTWWRGTVCDLTAGDAVAVTGALLTR